MQYVAAESFRHLQGEESLTLQQPCLTGKTPIYFSPHLCYYFNNQYTWQTRETHPFSKVSREEAPEAASAPTNKKWIPLASLYRACKVHVLTSLPVAKARFPEI